MLSLCNDGVLFYSIKLLNIFQLLCPEIVAFFCKANKAQAQGKERSCHS